MGATRKTSGRLEVNLFLSENRGGKSHFGTVLVSDVSGIWRFCTASRLQACLYLGLARTVYIRIYTPPYIWWFPSQKYRMYTVYMVLANPAYIHGGKAGGSLGSLFCWWLSWSCCMLRYASQRSYWLFARVETTHPEKMCGALSSCGQRGQVRLVERLNRATCLWLYRVPVLCFITMHLVFTVT
jgi:hypothetical protein